MSNHGMAFLRVMSCLSAGVLAVSSVGTAQSQASENEQAVRKLEHTYWRYVQDNDLPAYLAQWHTDFVGWPLTNAAPVHKDHITDWITSQTSKGLTFKSGEFKPASIQMIGDTAVVYYWITCEWLDKDGKGVAHTFRITHMWLKDGKDWQIIGGMSAPEPAASQK